MEGELHRTSSAFGGLYELHDSANPALYVVVISDADLPDGHAVVTGRVSPRAGADRQCRVDRGRLPAVPRVNEPIWLYLTPAVIAILIVVGMRVGYPVVRRDAATASPGGDHRPARGGRADPRRLERADRGRRGRS